MIWFTADTHFWHEKMMHKNYCDRPFKSVEEMNDTLINNWNILIKPDDIVYHLGDFSWGNISQIRDIYNRLNGVKYIILGNHDNANKIKKVFGDTHVLNSGHVVRYNKKRIVCDHWAKLRWLGRRKGYRHAFGHSHGNLDHPDKKAMDVGVDCHNYKPITFDQVIEGTQ